MTKQEAVKEARRYFGASVTITAQGSEEGTGYANRCYLMQRVIVWNISYKVIGIGRTWSKALQDALRTPKPSEGHHEADPTERRDEP